MTDWGSMTDLMRHSSGTAENGVGVSQQGLQGLPVLGVDPRDLHPEARRHVGRIARLVDPGDLADHAERIVPGQAQLEDDELARVRGPQLRRGEQTAHAEIRHAHRMAIEDTRHAVNEVPVPRLHRYDSLRRP